MTIDNFEKHINPAILERGRNYFNDGLVGDLEEDDHTWTAEVYGSEDYQVAITLNEQGEICEHSCDCPYDGTLCKHVAAVCYAVREETAKHLTISSEEISVKAKKGTFENLLNRINMNEYKDFIRRHAAQDKNFKTRFELFFSNKGSNVDIERKYGDLIRKLVRKYSDHGFIDYRATGRLSSDMNKLLNDGSDMIVRNNFEDAFLLTKAALKELITIIGECDDSDGRIGDTFDTAIQLLGDVAQSDNAAPALKQQIFDFLKTELTNQDYFSYGDFGYNLFSVFRGLAIQLNQSKEFIGFIDDVCRKLTGKYDDYQKDFFQKERILFYREIGWDDAAEKLVLQNLDIVEIRQAEVKKAVDRKDYAGAKRLIVDGIRIAEEKEHPGTVSQWKKELLDIAVLEKDTGNIRQLSRYFAFNHGFDKDYYRQWKQTFPAAEQNAEMEKLIAERINEANNENAKYRKNSFFASSRSPYLIYVAPVYIEEQMWDRLLALVQTENRLDALLTYHEYLAKRYPEEMAALYLPKFEHMGIHVEGRSQYADLARKMKMVLTDIPEAREPITKLVRDLIAKNPRRPAMIEELNKVMV
jgi:hypothetical protein